MQGHASRLEQVEDITSELKDKIEIKEKNRRNLSQKNLRPVKGICKKSMTLSKYKDQT
jgi:hypothetical protein